MTRFKALASMLLAAAIATPALAMAQDHDDKHEDKRDDHRVEQQHHDDRAARGAGPNHDWHRGDRLPAGYRDKRYEVSDWKSHHLSAPPSGYHWVQVNGDFVLAAVATGVIADLLLSQ